MAKIALVTDSSSDLTSEMQREFDANIIKLTVTIGDKTFQDGDLTSVEFFFRQLKSPDPPVTHPASLDEFISLYSRLLENHEEIISIHLSEALSKTLSIARQAREVLDAGKRIHLVNSSSVSMGTALLVAEAARAIRAGLSSQEILAELNQVQANTTVVLMLDTLTFLRRNGRLGGLQGMFSSFMNIKPIIRINQEGAFESVGRVKDQDQGMTEMIKLFRAQAAGRRVISSGVVHGSAREAGLRLKHALEYAFDVDVSFFSEVGPIVGANSGPGLIGAALRFA